MLGYVGSVCLGYLMLQSVALCMEIDAAACLSKKGEVCIPTLSAFGLPIPTMAAGTSHHHVVSEPSGSVSATPKPQAERPPCMDFLHFGPSGAHFCFLRVGLPAAVCPSVIRAHAFSPGGVVERVVVLVEGPRIKGP